MPGACPLRSALELEALPTLHEHPCSRDKEGGFASNTIPYHMEDPQVRRYFEEKLKAEGAEMTMPPEVYTAAGARIQVMED